MFTSRLPSLSFAFETLKSPRTTSVLAEDIDIRQYYVIDRAMLSTNQHVKICIEGIPLIEISRPLFIATSTKPDLLVGEIVDLPFDVDGHGVYLLIEYIKTLMFSKKKNLRMESTIPVYDQLSVTAAAEALGMNRYTNHIYKKCEAQLRNNLPTYAELDACIQFAKPHARLLRIVASCNLAVRMRANDIPDADYFNEYLEQNPILKSEIESATTEYNEGIQKMEKDKAFWRKKSSEAATDKKSIFQKLKLSGTNRKFTLREAAHYRKARSTGKLPKSC
ncbi:hypothetical protein GQ44DRAFT_777043 [Phaeosphaeriaceae sp. PMI808]|nr:hypothetical protein GQ44DRAFT_777043 [Phaeosphaeriaceae sp. PMI808]